MGCGGCREIFSTWQSRAPNFDRIQIRVEAKRYRHDMRMSIRANGGEAAQPLGLQICLFSGGKYTHFFLDTFLQPDHKPAVLAPDTVHAAQHHRGDNASA
jgi:hypothetical protein